MHPTEIAHRNFDAWARRFKLRVDNAKIHRVLDKHFYGSILTGPLTVCLSLYLKADIPAQEERRIAAAGAARLMVSIIRHDRGDNTLYHLAKEIPSAVLAKHHQVLTDAITWGLNKREQALRRITVVNPVPMKPRRRSR